MGILLFNWIGYRLFSSYIEGNANSELEAQLDNNGYDESELISIKVPAVHLCYYTPSIQFERVDGQIEIGNVQYNYVKRRLYNDSLELLCIPNREAMKLHAAKDDFFKLVNDLQYTGQGKKSNSRPGDFKDFSVDQYIVNDLLKPVDLYYTITKRSLFCLAGLSSCLRFIPGQPPEKVS
jgi:hypothetical protein